MEQVKNNLLSLQGKRNKMVSNSIMLTLFVSSVDLWTIFIYTLPPLSMFISNTADGNLRSEPNFPSLPT